MCMFYNTPTQKHITKPITAYKVFTRNGDYPFQNNGEKPKRNTWLRARAPKWDNVKNYGFHVFTDKLDVEKFRINWNLEYCVIRKVLIRGTVYGVGRILAYPSGMRVSSMFIPKRKTKKK
jgi:hypothetical protein